MGNKFPWRSLFHTCKLNEAFEVIPSIIFLLENFVFISRFIGFYTTICVVLGKDRISHDSFFEIDVYVNLTPWASRINVPEVSCVINVHSSFNHGRKLMYSRHEMHLSFIRLSTRTRLYIIFFRRFQPIKNGFHSEHIRWNHK